MTQATDLIAKLSKGLFSFSTRITQLKHADVKREESIAALETPQKLVIANVRRIFSMRLVDASP